MMSRSASGEREGPVLDHEAVARLPHRLSFSRNGRAAEVRRVPAGEVEVAGNALRIADAAYGDEVPPLPVRVPNGRHTVYAYQWDHPQGVINVCAVVAFRRQRWAVARPLTIANDMRPDLTAGIIVDSAEVRVGGVSQVVLPSGLGDGYYPVIGVYNYALVPQAVVLDFQVWRVREVILLPGQVLDEFAIVRRVGQDAEPGTAADRARG
jgi:hypothetical protein